MKCEEYLQALSTSPIDELSRSAAAEHVATCVECNRVTRVVVERERRMAMALGGMSSHIEPLDTAMYALAAARRRMVGRMYKLGLTLLAVAALATIVLLRSTPTRDGIPVSTRQFKPQCLGTREFVDLLRLALGPRARISIQSGSNVLTLVSTKEDLQKAEAVLDRYDNPGAANCVIPTPGSLKPDAKSPTQ